MVYILPDQLWMVIVGFIIAFVLAFGIGANDVANSFGTSVGSKVLTLRNACILGTIFETLGAMFLGARVSDTIRKGVIDVAPYNGTEELLMVGNVAALSGACIWLLIATFLSVPVSGTHSIVGATLGFALVAHGVEGVNWKKLGMIIGSWFISPLLAGGVSVGIFFLIRYFVLSKDRPLEPGLRLLPLAYGFTVVINIFSVFYEGPEMLHFDKIPLWGTFIISFGTGAIVTIAIRIWLVPYQRKKILEECQYQVANSDSLETSRRESFSEDLPVKKCFDTVEYHAPPMEAATFDGGAGDSYCYSGTKLIESGEVKLVLDITPEKQMGVGVRIKEMDTGRTSASKTALIDAEYHPNKNKVAKADIVEADENCAKVPLPETPPNSRSKSTDPESLDDKREDIKDKPEAARLFSFLQILTAIFGSFAHGGNDVSNAIGPLVALWMIATEGNVMQKSETPIWILFYGGVGISFGLWIWGRRVIKTLGEDLSKITPSSGFCIELGAALTVLIASNVGLPISTTHCKVGSVVLVGRFRSRENVDWKVFRNIIIAWAVTLPIAGGISAAIMAGLQLLVPH